MQSWTLLQSYQRLDWMVTKYRALKLSTLLKVQGMWAGGGGGGGVNIPTPMKNWSSHPPPPHQKKKKSLIGFYFLKFNLLK